MRDYRRFMLVFRSVAIATVLLFGVVGIAGAAEASPAPEPGPAFSDPINLLNSFALLLLFGTLMVIGVIVVVLVSQQLYFRASERLARRGISTSPRVVRASQRMTDDEERGAGGPTPELTIVGPDTVATGRRAAFSAVVDGRPASGASWAIEPADAGELSATSGAGTSLLAKKAGPITVTATVGETSVSLPVTVEDAQPQGTVLPFVGAGWGSIVVAIVVITLIAVLGVGGVLSSEGIAGLLGTLIGYLFGIRGNTANSSSTGTAQPAAPVTEDGTSG